MGGIAGTGGSHRVAAIGKAGLDYPRLPRQRREPAGVSDTEYKGGAGGGFVTATRAFVTPARQQRTPVGTG
jgi:hypothetical protein